MEGEGGGEGRTPKGNEQSFPIGEAAAAKTHATSTDPPAPDTAIQDVSADLTPGREQPLLVRVIKDNDLSAFERKTVTFGKLGFVVAVLSLAAACVAAYIVYQQFAEMADQTDLLSRSARQARTDAKDAGIATAKQLTYAQRQAAAAQAGVNTMQRQMLWDQRPWIALDNTTARAVVFYEDLKGGGMEDVIGPAVGNESITDINRRLNANAAYVNFYLRYSIKNFGHSPANVRIHTTVVDQGYPRYKNLLEVIRRENVCGEQQDKDWAWTIVPGGTTYNHISSLEINQKMWETRTIEPTVVGCIWYRSTIGDKSTIHKTPFAGHISMATDEKGQPVQDPSPIPIPLRRLFKSPIDKNELKVVDVWIMGDAD